MTKVVTELKSFLTSFQNRLKYISENKKEPHSERLAAAYYFDLLKNYTYRDLTLQYGFARGVGGSGDNVIAMPLVERDENGSVILEDGKLKITHCMFNNFRSYLNYIQRHQSVHHDCDCWMSIPSDLDGLPRDVYQRIWFRHQGIIQDRMDLV